MSKVLQTTTSRIILSTLLLLEIFCVITYYSFNFGEYVSVVLILLVFPITYYAYKLINVPEVPVEYINGIKPKNNQDKSDDLTRAEVNKLVDSPAFKEYERWKLEAGKDRNNNQANLDREAEEIAKQLEEKEEEIFTDDGKSE